MWLQSRFGTDERFRMDSRFLEEDEDKEEEESGGAVGGGTLLSFFWRKADGDEGRKLGLRVAQGKMCVNI